MFQSARLQEVSAPKSNSDPLDDGRVKSIEPNPKPNQASAIYYAPTSPGRGLAFTPLDPDPIAKQWDDLLAQSSLGHYEQGVAWAEYKRAEGWSCHRELVKSSSGVPLGGFQIFWKQRGVVRLGYASRGPVIFQGTGPEAPEIVLDAFERAIRSLGLIALVAQVPDADTNASMGLATRGARAFLPGQVAEATLLVDLSGDEAALISRALPTTRKKIRQALARGLSATVYRGFEEGFTNQVLPDFFRLMEETCKRQQTTPNPRNVELLRAMWEPFAARDAARLVMVHDGTRPVAGVLSFSCGKRFTLLKKGWDGSCGDKRANELATFTSLKLAQAEGYALADFGACDRDMALRLLQGQEPTEADQSSRHFFNYSFGTKASLLARPQIVIPNPLVRLGYQFYAWWKGVR